LNNGPFCSIEFFLHTLLQSTHALIRTLNNEHRHNPTK
jgi:hypothetical protein